MTATVPAKITRSTLVSWAEEPFDTPIQNSVIVMAAAPFTGLLGPQANTAVMQLVVGILSPGSVFAAPSWLAAGCWGAAAVQFAGGLAWFFSLRSRRAQAVAKVDELLAEERRITREAL